MTTTATNFSRNFVLLSIFFICQRQFPVVSSSSVHICCVAVAVINFFAECDLFHHICLSIVCLFCFNWLFSLINIAARSFVWCFILNEIKINENSAAKQKRCVNVFSLLLNLNMKTQRKFRNLPENENHNDFTNNVTPRTRAESHVKPTSNLVSNFRLPPENTDAVMAVFFCPSLLARTASSLPFRFDFPLAVAKRLNNCHFQTAYSIQCLCDAK